MGLYSSPLCQQDNNLPASPPRVPALTAFSSWTNNTPAGSSQQVLVNCRITCIISSTVQCTCVLSAETGGGEQLYCGAQLRGCNGSIGRQGQHPTQTQTHLSYGVNHSVGAVAQSIVLGTEVLVQRRCYVLLSRFGFILVLPGRT